MKLCTQCGHHRMVDITHLCAARAGGAVDPVTGRQHYPVCADMRQTGADCGPEGALWIGKTADAAMRPPMPAAEPNLVRQDGTTTLGPVYTKDGND